MAAIHFMDGEKGGVGKSLFARVMVQYCIDNKLSYELVEADQSNPDVGAFYPDNHKTAVFSESERKAYDADEIFNLALTTSVIVNLPAQVYPAVTDWIERNQILELTGKNKVKIYKWFVCSGGYDSVQLFMQSLERFENKIKHIFIRNCGLCDDWKHVDGRKDLQELIKAYKVAVINFPKFSYRE
ncbi:mobilization protein [Nostoc sp. UIC 10890]